MAKSIMQTEKECYVTGSTLNLHKHHIFGGPFRKKAEKWGLWAYLRADYHIQTPNAVHNNREFDLELKKEAQRNFECLYGHDIFMQEFRKNYL